VCVGGAGMPRYSDIERLKKREKVQRSLYDLISKMYERDTTKTPMEKLHKYTSLSMLKRSIISEFKYSDSRSINGQIRLMEVENRIEVDGDIVIIREPRDV